MATKDANLNIRINEKTRERAKKTLRKLGLDLSSGITLFLNTVIDTKSIPFPIRTENGYTHADESRMLQEAKETIALYKQKKKKAYCSAEELHKTLLG